MITNQVQQQVTPRMLLQLWHGKDDPPPDYSRVEFIASGQKDVADYYAGELWNEEGLHPVAWSSVSQWRLI